MKINSVIFEQLQTVCSTSGMLASMASAYGKRAGSSLRVTQSTAQFSTAESAKISRETGLTTKEDYAAQILALSSHADRAEKLWGATIKVAPAMIENAAALWPLKRGKDSADKSATE